MPSSSTNKRARPTRKSIRMRCWRSTSAICAVFGHGQRSCTKALNIWRKITQSTSRCECPRGERSFKHTNLFCRNGPSEFYVTGLLKDWSVVEEANKIEVPTLLLNGAYDEAADSTVIPFFRAIPRVKWYTFAESSHTPHWEEREKYMKLVSDFFLKA